jgi:hypothetical protein
MRGPRSTHLALLLIALAGVPGLAGTARAEMLFGTLTTETAPGDFKAPAHGRAAKPAFCGRPAPVFRADGSCFPQSAGWAVSTGQEELDLLETLMTIMVFSDQWIYQQTNGTCPPPQTPPRSHRDPPPVEPPPHVMNTPEPATLLLGLLGSALAWLARHRQRRRQPAAPGAAALLPQAA